MAETLQQLVKLFQRQMEAQNKQLETQQQQMKDLMDRLAGPVPKVRLELLSASPTLCHLTPLQSCGKIIWLDLYLFASANSVPEDKVAQVFLTNQTMC